MNHYERIGVAPDASAGEVRAAYLEVARRVHPDAVGGDPSRSGEMAAINDAWTELSDPERRRRYDARIGVGDAILDVGVPRRPVVRPSEGPAFRPLDDGPDPDRDQSSGYTEDEGDPTTATGYALAMVPATLAIVAVALVALGLLFGSGTMFRLALFAMVAALVSLVVIPVVVMGRAVRHEEHGRSS